MPNSDDKQTILIEQDDAVATIWLNRPERRNALTAAMLKDLLQAVLQLAADKTVRVIILTGTGAGFCAGQDLAERDPRQLKKMPDLAGVQRQLYHPLITALADTGKPVIAAVDGIAAGAGAGIALQCDLVICSAAARFYFAFARVGLAIDAGVGWHLVRQLGRARATQLLMSAGSLSAGEALAAGLVSEICPDDGTVQERAIGLARQLASGPRTALSEIKALCRQAGSLDFKDYLQAEAAAQGRAGADPDYAEGVLAFLEKRPPAFSR